MASALAWNITYDGMSPMFQFLPYSDTSAINVTESGYLTSGWVTWFTESQYISSGQEDAIGNPYHLTSLYGASVSLDYYGSGVVLYGDSNSSYLITMDGTNVTDASAQDGVLYSVSGQTIGNHTVVLTAHPDTEQEVLQFQQATVTSQANTTYYQPTVVQVSSQQSDSYRFLGSWESSRTWPGVPNPTETSPFRFTADPGASFSIQFNGRAAAIYGSTTNSHQLYDVTLNGATQTFNESTEWLIGNTLLFFEDNLDPNATHTLSVTNGDEAFAFNYVQIWQFQSYATSYSSPSSSSLTSLPASSKDSKSSNHSTSPNTTAIIAGSVAALFVVLLAAMIALCRWSRIRKKREETNTFSPSPFLLKSLPNNAPAGLEEVAADVAICALQDQDFMKEKQELNSSALAQLKPAYHAREPSLVQAMLTGNRRGWKKESSMARVTRGMTPDGLPKYDEIDRHRRK